MQQSTRAYDGSMAFQHQLMQIADSEMQPSSVGNMRGDHLIKPFLLHMNTGVTAGLTAFSQKSTSPKRGDARILTCQNLAGKRKRARSHTSHMETTDHAKRGEKWTEAEEELLRSRRNGGPESWEETRKYFAGRTTNALQKKWKLMTSTDKMRIEPELEDQILVAVAKHAPDYLRRLAGELGMEEENLGIIEHKMAILYVQGKLPLKKNLAISKATRASSPVMQASRSSIARPSPSAKASTPQCYSSQPLLSSYGSVDKPTSQAMLSFNSTYQSTTDSVSNLAILSSPLLNSVYYSDSEAHKHVSHSATTIDSPAIIPAHPNVGDVPYSSSPSYPAPPSASSEVYHRYLEQYMCADPGLRYRAFDNEGHYITPDRTYLQQGQEAHSLGLGGFLQSAQWYEKKQ